MKVLDFPLHPLHATILLSLCFAFRNGELNPVEFNRGLAQLGITLNTHDVKEVLGRH